MKRFSRMMIMAIVAVALIFAFSPNAIAKTYKLTYSNFFPPTHIQSKLAASWCQEVEKRTAGKVKVDYYPGQTLTKAKQCYDGTVEGLSDIGFSVLAYTRGRFPLTSAVDLPLGYTSGKAATKIVNMVYNKYKPKEFKDVQVMYLHAHGPGLVHTKTKAVRYACGNCQNIFHCSAQFRSHNIFSRINSKIISIKKLLNFFACLKIR